MLVQEVKKKKKVPKDPAIKEGRPLPDEGTCKHYKKSYRWLRYVFMLSVHVYLIHIIYMAQVCINVICTVLTMIFSSVNRFPCCGKVYPCDVCHEDF